MKIAIATEQGKVSEHFGHCEGFTMYVADGTEIKTVSYVQNPGHQPGFLPVFLKEQGADVIIAGGMGQRAQQLFTEKGIAVIVGAAGECDQTANNYLKGELKSSESVCHEHEHAHECKGH
jgi:predicted Fe-Mo cluster-binding NifX family protein